VKGILATRVDKGDAVLKKMAATFRALASVAKWDREQNGGAPAAGAQDSVVERTPGETPEQGEQNGGATRDVLIQRPPVTPEYHYNIQIHLPATQQVSVYNAIFKSLREHLL